MSISRPGAGFVCKGKPFVPIGVTYYRPQTGWAPQVWKKFDPEATRADFLMMRSLGMSVVRVFLSYGSFYPTPGQVDPQGMAKLDRFLQLAEDAGLYIHPTGPDHWEGTPAWAQADRYSDEALLKAQELFLKTVAARYRNRAVIWAYDLINEPEIPWETAGTRARWNRWLGERYGDVRSLKKALGMPAATFALGEVLVPGRDDKASPWLRDYQQFRESIANEWTRRQAAAIHHADPEALW